MNGAAGVCGAGGRAEPASPPVDVKTPYAKIGELTQTNDRLSGALGKPVLESPLAPDRITGWRLPPVPVFRKKAMASNVDAHISQRIDA